MLVPFNPFRNLDRFFDEEEFSWIKFPRINIEKGEKEVIVETEIPGIKPEKIDISINDNTLTLKGKREEEKEEKKKNYYSKEFSSGYFERSIKLPSGVKGEKAKAEYNNGILKISIPRTQKELGKKIKLQIKK